MLYLISQKSLSSEKEPEEERECPAEACFCFDDFDCCDFCERVREERRENMGEVYSEMENPR